MTSVYYANLNSSQKISFTLSLSELGLRSLVITCMVMCFLFSLVFLTWLMSPN